MSVLDFPSNANYSQDSNFYNIVLSSIVRIINYIQDNYDMTYEIKHYEDILDSVKKLITCKVNKEKFEK